VIYLDTSVALAQIFSESQAPPPKLWRETLISSRLLEYEMWMRIHARGLAQSHGNEARALIDRVTLLELTPAVLARALQPFPVPLRTLDALHLASIDFLRGQGQEIELASYDQRLTQAGSSLAVTVYPL
jgi:uncharacterized protein